MTNPDSDTTDKTKNTPSQTRPKEAMPVYVVGADYGAEVDLLETVGVLIRGWKWFVVVLLITGIVSYVILRSRPSEYESSLRLVGALIDGAKKGDVQSYVPLFTSDDDTLEIIEELNLRKPDGTGFSAKEAAKKIRVTVDAKNNTILVSARSFDADSAKKMVEQQVKKGLERVADIVLTDMRYLITDSEHEAETLKAQLNIVTGNQEAVRVPLRRIDPTTGTEEKKDDSEESLSILFEERIATAIEIVRLESLVTAMKRRIAANDLRLPLMKIGEASTPTQPVPKRKSFVFVVSLMCAFIGTGVVLLLRDAMLKKIRF